MQRADFFPQRPDSNPMIYAYGDSTPKDRGLLKTGYTKHIADKRTA